MLFVRDSSQPDWKEETVRPIAFTWEEVVWNAMVSRAIDEVEEQELFQKRLIPMQFSARGHELSQIILGLHLRHPNDGVSVYYRNRPLLLALGLSPLQALAGPLGREISLSRGRDGGMVFHRLGQGIRPTVFPMCGDVGSQYTQIVGWGQAVAFRAQHLHQEAFQGAIGVAMGGDGSTATGGFWSALTIATTQKLPVLFYIEDNGYAISVPSVYQSPGGNFLRNLESFSNLLQYSGDGTDPKWLRETISLAVSQVRSGYGPALIRASVPRICGHSIQDNQSYKQSDLRAQEVENDPLKQLKSYLVPIHMTEGRWETHERHAQEVVQQSLHEALDAPLPAIAGVPSYVFFHPENGLQKQGGMYPEGKLPFKVAHAAQQDPQRVNLASAIRRTLDVELTLNDRLVIFGQDVGVKGGIHGVTAQLQDKHGVQRVFDTSLSEEGIVGRAVGMALCGLVPCPEIQFRKYADSAMEQIRNVGTIRWRTANNFAAPMVLRMTVGATGREDHWHNMCDESIWAHLVGWKVAFPSNASDAVGLLRSALRGNDPVMFLEHRALLDGSQARRPYPGDHYQLPFGTAQQVRHGEAATIVSWGQMVQRCEQAIDQLGLSIDLIDLRTIVPWDEEAVLSSVRRTGRCLIVHEDLLTCGFGAEVSAVIGERELLSLEAPVMRLAVDDLPIPYQQTLACSVVPSVELIIEKILELTSF